MKTLTKAVVAASLATGSVAAYASTSLTVGAVSDYYFRGANLGDAGAYVSLDYENSGFYAGTWWIDDATAGNDGMETDFYLGYAGEVDGFSYGIGYNRYEYTYTTDFEQEIVLSAGIAGFTLDVALGEDDDDGDAGGAGFEDDADYTVIQLGYSNGPWGVTLGSWDQDQGSKFVSETAANAGDQSGISENEYKWFEVSYSADFGGVDATATVGTQFDMEMNNGLSTVEPTSAGNNYIILDVSKGFDL